LVTQFDRDVENGVTRVPQVGEAPQDLGRDQQSFGRAKLCSVEIAINADDRDAGFHRQVESARITVRLLEEILNRHRELPRQLTESLSKRLDHIMGECVPLES